MEGLYDAVARFLGPAERLHLRCAGREMCRAVDDRRRPRVPAGRAFLLCHMVGWSLSWAVYWSSVRARTGPAHFDALWCRRALWWAVDFPNMLQPTITVGAHARVIRQSRREEARKLLLELEGPVDLEDLRPA